MTRVNVDYTRRDVMSKEYMTVVASEQSDLLGMRRREVLAKHEGVSVLDLIHLDTEFEKTLDVDGTKYWTSSRDLAEYSIGISNGCLSMKGSSVGCGLERAVRVTPTFDGNKAEVKLGKDATTTDVEKLVHHYAGKSHIPRVSSGSSIPKSEVEAIANLAYYGKEWFCQYFRDVQNDDPYADGECFTQVWSNFLREVEKKSTHMAAIEKSAQHYGCMFGAKGLEEVPAAIVHTNAHRSWYGNKVTVDWGAFNSALLTIMSSILEVDFGNDAARMMAAQSQSVYFTPHRSMLTNIEGIDNIAVEPFIAMVDWNDQEATIKTIVEHMATSMTDKAFIVRAGQEEAGAIYYVTEMTTDANTASLHKKMMTRIASKLVTSGIDMTSRSVAGAVKKVVERELVFASEMTKYLIEAIYKRDPWFCAKHMRVLLITGKMSNYELLLSNRLSHEMVMSAGFQASSRVYEVVPSNAAAVKARIRTAGNCYDTVQAGVNLMKQPWAMRNLARAACDKIREIDVSQKPESELPHEYHFCHLLKNKFAPTIQQAELANSCETKDPSCFQSFKPKMTLDTIVNLCLKVGCLNALAFQTNFTAKVLRTLLTLRIGRLNAARVSRETSDQERRKRTTIIVAFLNGWGANGDVICPIWKSIQMIVGGLATGNIKCTNEAFRDNKLAASVYGNVMYLLYRDRRFCCAGMFAQSKSTLESFGVDLSVSLEESVALMLQAAVYLIVDSARLSWDCHERAAPNAPGVPQNDPYSDVFYVGATQARLPGFGNCSTFTHANHLGDTEPAVLDAKILNEPGSHREWASAVVKYAVPYVDADMNGHVVSSLALSNPMTKVIMEGGVQTVEQWYVEYLAPMNEHYDDFNHDLVGGVNCDAIVESWDGYFSAPSVSEMKTLTSVLQKRAEKFTVNRKNRDQLYQDGMQLTSSRGFSSSPEKYQPGGLSFSEGKSMVLTIADPDDHDEDDEALDREIKRQRLTQDAPGPPATEWAMPENLEAPYEGEPPVEEGEQELPPMEIDMDDFTADDIECEPARDFVISTNSRIYLGEDDSRFDLFFADHEDELKFLSVEEVVAKFYDSMRLANKIPGEEEDPQGGGRTQGIASSSTVVR